MLTEVTRKEAESWGIEIPIMNAIKRYGYPNFDNQADWILFLISLFDYMHQGMPEEKD